MAKARRIHWHGVDLETRFWLRVKSSLDGCWEWQGHVGQNGYGQMSHNGRAFTVHRYSWELHYGAVPEGLDVCHRCDNRICVNPKHLFVGTRAENLRDCREKGRQGTTKLRGEQLTQSLLDDNKVRTIRFLLSCGVPQYAIADRFKVRQSTISAIATGLTWRHVQ